jgi:hypothetical protein
VRLDLTWKSKTSRKRWQGWLSKDRHKEALLNRQQTEAMLWWSESQAV